MKYRRTSIAQNTPNQASRSVLVGLGVAAVLETDRECRLIVIAFPTNKVNCHKDSPSLRFAEC